MIDIEKNDDKQSLCPTLFIMIVLEFLAALVIKTIYNNFVLYYDLKEDGWPLSSFSLDLVLALLFFLFIIVNSFLAFNIIKDKSKRMKAMKHSVIAMIFILAFVFFIVPEYNKKEYIQDKYTKLVENFRKNPELNQRTTGRFPYYPIDIKPEVYEKNKAYIELMSGYKNLDPKIYYKYYGTNAKYDLYLARPNQQRHVLFLMTLNDKRISDALAPYMDDKFLSIGEYRRFIQQLLNENIITEKQASEKL